MSSKILPSIETLPVEILHRIFDNLDTQTILFALRPVCRLFRAIVGTYNRYIFDFKSISKSNFHLICQLINPERIISLTLYHNEQIPDQISLFIPLIRLRKLTRLHSINLFGIEEFQLNIILKNIHLNCLSSFSLNIRKYDDRRKKTTEHFLSVIMAQSTLRKADLNIKSDRISNITWPVTCRIEYLMINEDITFNDMCTIFLCSPQLHTLVIKQSLSNMIDHIVLKSSFPQLTSLTIEKLDVSIHKLESFLVLTPSLIYLKLIGEDCVLDGKRWEQFLQINLPHLDKFQFFVGCMRAPNQTRQDLELIIESFRSPFWIEHKKWFVACEFNINRSYKFQIYSIPICKSTFQYELDSEKVFLSTSSILLYDDPAITTNINEIILPLKLSTNNILLKRINSLFPNVTKLRIDFERRISVDLLRFLPSIINISQLVEVKLESFYFNKDNKNLLYDVLTIIQQSDKLTSLIIHSRFCKYELYPFLNDICSILPRQIKHLQIPINQLDQIKLILERCQYLSVVQFEITRTKFSADVIEWFNQNTIDSTCWRHSGCDIIWIGKKINQSNLIHKRIKLIDHRLESEQTGVLNN